MSPTEIEANLRPTEVEANLVPADLRIWAQPRFKVDLIPKSVIRKVKMEVARFKLEPAVFWS